MSCLNRFAVATMAVLGLVIPSAEAQAQAFSEASRGLVNYRLSEFMPRAACDVFASSVKIADLVSLQAREVAGRRRRAHPLPGQRRHCAGGGVRGRPARAVERTLLHDRQRRARRGGIRGRGPHRPAQPWPCSTGSPSP